MDNWILSRIRRGTSYIRGDRTKDPKDVEEENLLEQEQRSRSADIRLKEAEAAAKLAEAAKIAEETNTVKWSRRLKIGLTLFFSIICLLFLVLLLLTSFNFIHLDHANEMFSAGGGISAILAILSKLIGKD